MPGDKGVYLFGRRNFTSNYNIQTKLFEHYFFLRKRQKHIFSNESGYGLGVSKYLITFSVLRNAIAMKLRQAILSTGAFTSFRTFLNIRRRLEKNYSICNTRIFGLFRGLFVQYNIL